MSSRNISIVACVLTLLVVGCARRVADPVPAEPPAPTSTAAERLVVGDVDANDPVRKFEWLTPFADHLAAQLEAFGIVEGEARIAPDLETMASWLEAGEVDIYVDSLYPALIVSRRTGGMPILRHWKGGSPEYHTVFVTTADSGVGSLDELTGHLVAFDNKASTSGFFLPVSFLRSRGFELAHYGSADARPPADRIGYVFTGDDENALQWLLSGRVAAAAVDNIALERSVPAGGQLPFVVLAETDPVHRQVVVARPDLDPELQGRLIELLLGLHHTPEGRAVLESIDAARFDEIPGGAEAVLASLETAYDAVREELERWMRHER